MATERAPGVVSQRYDEVGALVDNAVQVPLTKTQGAASQIVAQRGNAALRGEGRAVEMVAEAINRPGMNYAGIRDLRSAIGEMLDNPRQLVASDISKAELKRIHDALSDDLASAVRRAGGSDAVQAFEHANDMAKAAAALRETLQRVTGDGVELSDESIIAYVQRIAGSDRSANIRQLRLLKRSASESWDEVASAVAGRLGRDQRGDFSPAQFITDYGTLSPMGRTYLFGGTGHGHLKSALDDILAVSKRLAVSRFKNGRS